MLRTDKLFQPDTARAHPHRGGSGGKGASDAFIPNVAQNPHKYRPAKTKACKITTPTGPKVALEGGIPFPAGPHRVTYVSARTKEFAPESLRRISHANS